MADKIKCPKCGEENYPTDPVCLNCGASLKEPQPGPSRPTTAQAAAAAAAPPAATDKRAPGKPAIAKKDTPPTAMDAITPWLKALGMSVALTALEMIVLYAISHGENPRKIWGLHFVGGMVPRILLATLMCGVLRAALVGGLLYLTGWGSNIGLVIGGALGFTGLGTIPGGLAAGFMIALALEGHKIKPPAG